MTAADLIPCSSAPWVMTKASLYPSFKRVRKEAIATADKPTHLKDSLPAPEAPCQRNPPGQASVTGCSSPTNVNPSQQRIVKGVGVGAVEDRRRVFDKNTKMNATHSTRGESPW